MEKAASKSKNPVTRHTVVRTFKATNKSKWEIVKATTGTKVEYFFRVVSRNGNILATGRGLNRAENAIKSMNAVRKSCFFSSAGIYYPKAL